MNGLSVEPGSNGSVTAVADGGPRTDAHGSPWRAPRRSAVRAPRCRRRPRQLSTAPFERALGDVLEVAIDRERHVVARAADRSP